MSALPLKPALRAPLPLEKRPSEPLPSPSDWSFELIDRYRGWELFEQAA